MAEAWDVEPSPSDATLQWFRQRIPMTEQQFHMLDAESRTRAFTVSGVAELDLVSTVWDSLERAVRDGTTLADFRAEVGEALESQWGGENPSRLETIFRTNVQSAYSAGRYRQNNQPEVQATHPYSKFSAIIDGRTSDICEALDGIVLPSDDPFWSSHQPPLHFNCRSDVTALTEEEASEYGVAQVAPDVEADDGFGGVLEPLEPNLINRPAELVAAYEMKQHL